MTHYQVTGMSCAACQSHVEKAVQKVEGVDSVSVSLLTNSMQVEGSADPETVIRAVKDAGYGASLRDGNSAKGSGTKAAARADVLEDSETPKMLRRLIFSLIFLIPLMYVSMGHMMWGWPVPAFLAESHVNMGIWQLVLAAIVMVINQKFFVNGFKGLIHRAPNMDTLVSLGSGAGFVYSTVVLFVLAWALETGDEETAMAHMHDFYFESSAMILTLITVGKMLEAHSKGKTTDALKSLMKLAPETAVLVRDGVQVTVPVEEVVKGDIFQVRPGENIPVDGVVVSGSGAVNEAALTGESLPVDKMPGSRVSSGTVNQSGFLMCEATEVGEDTTLAKIIQLVSDAAATKAPIAKIADKVSAVFVPAVMSIAAVAFLVWLFMGKGIGFAMARGISVLVISCPCALGLATPVAIMVGSGKGARNGILFKTAAALEAAGKTDIVVMDKTGTITEGKPKVTDVVPAEGVPETELLNVACSLEKKSEHPLAAAVTAFGEERGISLLETGDFEASPGNGLRGVIGSDACFGGNMSYIGRSVCPVPDALASKASALAEQGKTPLFFARGSRMLGLIAVADTVKPTSSQAVSELGGMGIRTVMLTGDNERTAGAIQREVGADAVVAGVLPEGKEAVVARLQAEGWRVAMVGDGINDAPALTRADTGIAIGAGTDVALDAADVVLMKSDLLDAVAAIRLSRRVILNIRENLFWAFIYNCIGIPLAIGALIPWGITLNPMFGAAAMSLSSFCVVSNALRLNLIHVYGTRHDRQKKKQASLDALKEFTQKPEQKSEMTADEKEEEKMTETVKINGMMCVHCERHVKEALEGLGLTVNSVSHTAAAAVIEAKDDVTEEMIKKAVTDAGYDYVGIE